MPVTAWIAAGVTLLAATIFVASLWFDRLFEARAAMTVASLAEHLGAKSILAVFAHPDDEILAAGALADAGARSDVIVRTITLTRGEAGFSEPRVARTADLAVVREAELRRYGFALGIDEQEIWDFPDGGLGGVPRELLITRIADQIHTWSPELVLTFDPTGGYNGHPDHRAAGLVTTQAVNAVHRSSNTAASGAAPRPRHIAYLVAPSRAFATLGSPALRNVARVQPEPNVAVPVAARLRVLGSRIHASQWLDRQYPLPGWLLFDFWDKEHYAIRPADALESDQRS